MIKLVELTKYYGEAKAVGPLSLTIEQGEVVGLLGLNGAGKTTTLRMLASDLLPTSGSMTVDGVDLVEEPENIRSKIGYLPDRPPLYDEMTVHEYLVFAAKLRGMPSASISSRVDEVIGLTHLAARQHDVIGTLSHGFRQRVGIGQAIVHQPKLLLLDEPISGLDPVQIVEMRGLIRSLRGEHTTVLSSHILSEISETCDRLLVIRDGEIVASGSESDLAQQMTSRAVVVTLRAPVNYREKPAEAATERVRSVDGVARVVQLPTTEEDSVRLRIDATKDVRAEVCQAIVEGGFGILGLEGAQKELESVFLELTGASDSKEEES